MKTYREFINEAYVNQRWFATWLKGAFGSNFNSVKDEIEDIMDFLPQGLISKLTVALTKADSSVMKEYQKLDSETVRVLSKEMKLSSRDEAEFEDFIAQLQDLK